MEKENKEMKGTNRKLMKVIFGAMIAAIVVASTFAILPSGDSPLDETVVSIDPSDQTVSAGEIFTVNITVNPVEPIGAVGADLSFDSSLITAESVAVGDLFDPYLDPSAGIIQLPGVGTINNSTGTITEMYNIITGDPVLANGTFMEITFKAGSSAGTSYLNLSNVMVIDGGSVPFTVNNGSVTIVPEPPKITSYTISNTTIIPPQTTEIDVAFSEEVSWIIAIQKDATTVYDWTRTSTNPTKKIWDGTYEVNGTIVPVGDYTVNVTGTSTTTGLSVVNNTETITVILVANNPPVFSGETPADGSTVPISTSSLSVFIADPEGDSFDWWIETSPDVGSGSNTGDSNGTKNCGISGLDYSTTYTWWVNATDPAGSGEWTREMYTFTVQEVTPPTFELSDLTVEPDEILVGKTTNVSVNITNIGDVAGSYTAYLYVNGIIHYECNKTVELNASEMKTVTLVSHPISTPGTYEISVGNEALPGPDLIPVTLTVYPFNIDPASGIYNQEVAIQVSDATPDATITLYDSLGVKVTDAAAGTDGSARLPFMGTTTLNMAGNWSIIDESTSYTRIFPVKPIENLTVDVIPSEVLYNKSELYVFNGTVTYADGGPVAGAEIVVYWLDVNNKNKKADKWGTIKTGSDGEYTIQVKGLEGVGVYNITAPRNISGDNTPELLGYRHVNVVPDAFTIEDISTATAKKGFTSDKIFNITYPDNTTWDTSRPFNITISDGVDSNSTGNVTGIPPLIRVGNTNITFSLDENKNLTLSARWNKVGTWTITIKQNYSGATTMDGSYEYVGSETFDVETPANVNVDIIEPDKLNVKSPNENRQNITLQILGNTETTYGSPLNLIGVTTIEENITDAIVVEGDRLFPLTKDDYNYLGEGKWNIAVFPTKGNGEITIDVKWPGNDTVSTSITIDNGGNATVEPDRLFVDIPIPVNVTLKNKDGYPENRANVTFQYYYDDAWKGILNSTDGTNTPGNGLDGVYEFTVNSTEANKNIVVIARFPQTPPYTYAYAKIYSEGAHDLTAEVSPSTALAGASTEFKFSNISWDTTPTDVNIYIMNATGIGEFHDDPSKLKGEITPTKASTGNYTYKTSEFTEAGTYYVYVTTLYGKHDNLNNESTFIVEKASVEVSPTKLCTNVHTNETVEFTVRWNDELQNGTLRLIGVKENVTTGQNDTTCKKEDQDITLTVENGHATIFNVNATAVGEVTFEFKPENGIFAKTDGALEVGAPDIDVSPEIIYLGVDATITIRVTHAGTALEGVPVEARLPGGNWAYLGETKNGEISTTIFPTGFGGYLEFKVAGVISDKTIKIAIGLKIEAPSETEEETEITIRILTTNDRPVKNATVYIDGEALEEKTNSDGEVTYKPTKKGTYNITASYLDYPLVEKKTLKVTEKPGIPGFEAVALIIGALVALLLVHRRRKRR